MKSRAFAHVSFLAVLGLVLFSASLGFAQFTSNVQGVVQDSSGAVVPKATVTLVNAGTQVTRTTTSDQDGNFRILSLAPGAYKLTVEASGYAKSESDITLLTEQNLNVPVTLKVGSVTEAVTVTTEAPLVNTAETRNQLTLQTDSLSSLPLAGRSFISLVTLAPGVSGLGTMGGGQPGGAGTPGSGTDNYSTETAVDVSANGQGTVSNMFIVDGLNVTSAIRQGVLNLTPNPDAIQETSIQVNTFSSEYGGAGSIQMASTTKSGTDTFHGLVSDYYNYEKMYAKTEFMGPTAKYNPFHTNNFSGAVGGPIIPHHQFYFFFAAEPQRSAASTGNQTIFFPDKAFASWAQTNYPNTFGSKILNTYIPSRATISGVSSTFASLPACGTAGAPPCSNTPLIDSGIFNSSSIRNGQQYFVRVDKYFNKDRFYGSFFRTTLESGGPNVIPQFSSINHNWERALQVNWTHTFSPTTLNEAIFAQNRIEGVIGQTGDFTVPSVSVTGISIGYGVGFAQGDFIQHNYHWRDVLTHVRGAHVLKFGYDGWFGDDVEPFQGPWSQPKFSFDDLLGLAKDDPHTEAGVMYNPVTGQQQLWDWNAASKTWGVFAEDTWKARRNLTLTLGFRFDDQGNPYSRAASTVFGNFYLGTGSTFQQRVAGGFAKPTHNAINAAPKAFNPRIGFAWDAAGNGNTVVRGGFGIYANWLTQANIQEEFRGNPPGLILPTFSRGGTPAPIFTQGTGSKPPFGFTFPSPLCPAPPCLNAAGGVAGANAPIGGINPNIKSPEVYIWSGSVEHKVGNNFSASVLYSGSHGSNLVANGNQAGLVSYGSDINAFAGDLITHSLAPTRLNPSFGSIAYADNDRVSNYQGVTFDIRGRARRFFMDASFTRSVSKDDAGAGGTGYGLAYPTYVNPHQFYGNSPWDVPNRFSLTFNYELPGMNGGTGAVGHLTGGWGLSSTSIYQSGYPFTAWTTAPFLAVCADNSLSNVAPGCTAANPAVSFQSGSGDFNADGDNLDYPDVTSYHEATSRSAYLNGVFSPGQFSTPALGTEGNEKTQRFRQPSFVGTDLSVYKDTHITERLNFQVRFEFFNVFNHPNLYLGNNLSSGGFGKAVSQQLPRNWQLGAKLTF